MTRAATAARPAPGGFGPGLVIGGISGLVEVVVLGLRRVVADRLVFVPEYFWWLAPWVNAVIVGVVAGLAIAVLRRLPGIRPHLGWLRFGIPVAMAVGASLLLIGGLHGLAVVALAAGSALQLGRWLDRQGSRLDRVGRWSLPLVLVAAPLGARLGFGLHRPAIDRPAPADPAAPNILLIVLDTVRALELSLYGYDRPTSPAIDRFAARGVVFALAQSTAPWTLPSHGSMFTGRWSHHLSTEYRYPLDETEPTLAEALSRLGYQTAGFVANTEFATAETGLARGFAHYQDHSFAARRIANRTRLSRLFAGRVERFLGPLDKPGRVTADEINRRTLRWLDHRAPGPALLFLNYYDAHTPYAPPEPFWTQFVGAEPRRPLDIPTTPDRVAALRGAYDGAIAYLDSRVGQLLDSLDARRFLDSTVVIITSDHGEEFLEHGVLGHSNSLYLPAVHVPLVVVWPGRLPGRCRVDGAVSLRDLAETVREFAGAPEAFPGRSWFTGWGGPGDSLGTRLVLTSVLDEAGIGEPRIAGWRPTRRPPPDPAVERRSGRAVRRRPGSVRAGRPVDSARRPSLGRRAHRLAGRPWDRSARGQDSAPAAPPDSEAGWAPSRSPGLSAGISVNGLIPHTVAYKQQMRHSANNRVQYCGTRDPGPRRTRAKRPGTIIAKRGRQK